jgi:RHS repeat-associated protein
VQRNYFDPWGNPKSIYKYIGDTGFDTIANEEPGRGVETILMNFTLTRRGFTGHEHYPEFKIINMNARLYDPVIGRFFSPDNFVQVPEFTQGFNRYSYCLNNPLKYIDPTGNLIDIWDFDKNGNFIRRTKTTEFDQIRILNDDGSVFAETEKFKYKTIQAHNRPSDITDGKETTFDIFRIKGDDNAQQIFEFLANNTNIEWDRTQIGREGSEKNMVGTSHSEGSVATGSYLFETNYHIRGHTHNHPSGNPMPSFPTHNRKYSDISTVQPWIEKFQNLQLYIYIKDGSSSGYPKGNYRYDQFVRGVIVKP